MSNLAVHCGHWISDKNSAVSHNGLFCDKSVIIHLDGFSRFKCNAEVTVCILFLILINLNIQ